MAPREVAPSPFRVEIREASFAHEAPVIDIYVGQTPVVSYMADGPSVELAAESAEELLAKVMRKLILEELQAQIRPPEILR